MRWFRWWSGAMAVFGLAWLGLAASSHDWLHAGLGATYLVMACLQWRTLRRQRTTLHADGVRVHSGVWPARFIPWGDVVDVNVPTRWEPVGKLALRSGRSRSLPGVPEDVFRHLHAQLHPGEAPPVDARETAGGEFNGPFRSGVVQVRRPARRPPLG